MPGSCYQNATTPAQRLASSTTSRGCSRPHWGTSTRTWDSSTHACPSGENSNLSKKSMSREFVACPDPAPLVVPSLRPPGKRNCLRLHRTLGHSCRIVSCSRAPVTESSLIKSLKFCQAAFRSSRYLRRPALASRPGLSRPTWGTENADAHNWSTCTSVSNSHSSGSSSRAGAITIPLAFSLNRWPNRGRERPEMNVIQLT